MSANHSAGTEPTTETSKIKPKALVVGDGMTARIVAAALEDMGADVTIAEVGQNTSHVYFAHPGPDLDDTNQEIPCRLHDTKTLDSSRAPTIRRDKGLFKALFHDGTVGYYDAILPAPCISLRLVDAALPNNTELFTFETQVPGGEQLGFLMDYKHPSDPALGMSAIKAAHRNVLSGGSSVVCFRNVPVSHLFGETIYDEAREAGVQFVRFGDELPCVSSLDSNENAAPFRLKVRDVIVNEEELAFECDRLIAVTGPDSSSIPQWALEMTHNDLDDQGFLLSGNVHCSSGASLSSGLFLVGEATGNLDLIDGIAQAKAGAAKAYAWMKTSRIKADTQPLSIGSACVGCLTCLRVCPHGAITLKPDMARPAVEPLPSLCRECGTCDSMCPSAAIRLEVCPDELLLAFIKEVPSEEIQRTTFVFGCQRSAGVLAQTIEMPRDVRFMTVPCAGRVSEHVLWFAIAAGSRRVLVVGCHHGNCSSDTGTDRAGARVRRALDSGLLGEGPQRLGYMTVAPNEAARFERLLREFAAGKP